MFKHVPNTRLPGITDFVLIMPNWRDIGEILNLLISVFCEFGSVSQGEQATDLLKHSIYVPSGTSLANLRPNLTSLFSPTLVRDAIRA